jgi:hypothetical protein
VEFHPVSSVESVRAALEELLTGRKISCVIHSMAVSDFTTGYLAPGRRWRRSSPPRRKRQPCRAGSPGMKSLRQTVADILEHPDCALSCDKKVSSGEELILSLVKTPKLIGSDQEVGPLGPAGGLQAASNVSPSRSLQRWHAPWPIITAATWCWPTTLPHYGGEPFRHAHLRRRAWADTAHKREIAAGIARHVLDSIGKEGKTT